MSAEVPPEDSEEDSCVGAQSLSRFFATEPTLSEVEGAGKSLVPLHNLIHGTSVPANPVRNLRSWEAKTHHAAKKRSLRRNRNGFR